MSARLVKDVIAYAERELAKAKRSGRGIRDALQALRAVRRLQRYAA